MGIYDDFVGQVKKVKKKVTEESGTGAGYANAGEGVEDDATFRKRVDANPSAMTAEERKRRARFK